jgi:hypothetical protein
MKYVIVLLTCLLALVASVACSRRASNASYKESVKKALEQADLKDVTVSEDAHKNTITLGGNPTFGRRQTTSWTNSTSRRR